MAYVRGLFEVSLEEAGELIEKGYGVRRKEKLILSTYEAAYLLEQGRISILDESGRQLGSQEVIADCRRGDPDFWTKYLVYRDLRSKGYIVKESPRVGIDFEVYGRGEYGKREPRYAVAKLSEGELTKLDALMRKIRIAQAMGRELVLAVIDRRDDIVYYHLAEAELEKESA